MKFVLNVCNIAPGMLFSSRRKEMSRVWIIFCSTPYQLILHSYSTLDISRVSFVWISAKRLHAQVVWNTIWDKLKKKSTWEYWHWLIEKNYLDWWYMLSVLVVEMCWWGTRSFDEMESNLLLVIFSWFRCAQVVSECMEFKHYFKWNKVFLVQVEVWKLRSFVWLYTKTHQLPIIFNLCNKSLD